jgi:DNA-binding Lrp family transcriptional regulator
MIGSMSPDSATLDLLDTKIVRCLQLAPRIPFAAVAEVLDVSEQTVARRYRRLVKDGVLRVTIVVRPSALGQSNWIVRTQCKPSGSVALAQALARRDDISWVSLVSGGAEIVCVLRSRTEQARDDLLMQRLPRTAPVLGMSASMVLHRFLGADRGARGDWSALAHLLDADQEDPPEIPLLPEDDAMLEVLARDGRASYAALAAAAGIAEARATRRVQTLLEQRVADLDVDLAVSALGLHTSASLWLTVTPSELQSVGHALADCRQVAFAGAITGPQNLTASVVCRDVADLYSFITRDVGSIPGVQTLEVAPVLRHVKQAGSLTDGNRLAV